MSMYVDKWCLCCGRQENSHERPLMFGCLLDTIGGQKKTQKKCTHTFERGQMAEDYKQYLFTYPTCTEVQNPCLLYSTIIIKCYYMLGQKHLSCSVIQTMKNEQKTNKLQKS